jgi:hypothetical protein
MHAAEHQGRAEAAGARRRNVERHFVGSKRVFDLANPQKWPEIGISFRQMPLPALLAAAQEIEIKGISWTPARTRAR